MTLHRRSLESANLLWPAARFRDLAGPRPGGLLVGHVHDGEPAQELLGLDEGPVGEHQRAAGRVSAEDRAVLLQPSDEHVLASSLDLVHDRPGERPAPAEPLLAVVAHPLLVEVDEVLRHVCSLVSAADPVSASTCTPRTEAVGYDS